MAVDIIQLWIIGGKDFQSGAAIYQQHGTNAGLKALFKIETAYSRRRLEEELPKLIIDSPAKESPSRQREKYTVDQLPPHLQEKYRKKAKLYAQASGLHHQMKKADNNISRAFIRKEIIELDKEINAIWDECDAWMNEPPKTKSKMSISELYQKRNNLRSQISKAKKRNPSKLEKLQEELAEMEREIKQL